MVMAFWGKSVEQASVARQLGVIPGIGVPGSRLNLLASSKLRIVYRSGELPDPKSALIEGVPPIVLVHTRELP